MPEIKCLVIFVKLIKISILRFKIIKVYTVKLSFHSFTFKKYFNTDEK